MARSLFVDPYAGQAIDLLQEPARARAAALAKIADAQARATEIGGNATANAQQQSGQAWASAAQNIGQTIGAIPSQIEQARMRSLQQQNLQGQITDRAEQQKQRERENASVAAGSAAIKGAVGADGQIDHQKAADDWAKAGFPVAANAYLESVQKTRQTAQALTEGQQKIEAGKRQVAEAAANHMGELAIAGLKSVDTMSPLEARDYTLGLVANAASHGLVSEDDAKQFLMQSAQATPDQLKGIYQHFLDQAPAIKERALKDALTTSEINKNEAAAAKSRQPTNPTPGSLDAAAEALLTKKNLGQTLTPEEDARLKAYASRKTVVTDAAAVAAGNRQASTQEQQNAIQQNAQTFQQQQAGRKELTEKVEQPFQTSVAQANTLRHVVQAAQSGNKIAASLQSLEATFAAVRAAGLNRVNMAEIHQTGSAGSFMDNLESRFGKLTEGQPIPADLQKDMLSFADILEKAAADKYKEGFTAVTGRYGLKDEKPLTGKNKQYNPATGKVE